MFEKPTIAGFNWAGNGRLGRMTTNDWIFGTEASVIITATRDQLTSNLSLNKLLTDLRKELSPDLASQAIEMAQLQIAARKKFSSPEGMFFTRKGLEQSTSEAVAHYKAGLIEEGLTVADACCGIGGDSMALAASHRTVAIELDWNMARIANHNLADRKCENVLVVQADFNRFDFTPFGFVHVDPDRRPGKSRTTQAEYSDPPWKIIAERLGNQFAAVKLAPATILDEFSTQVHRQWIGSGRECREQLAWFNSPVWAAGGKTATVVDGSGSDHESITGNSDDQPGICETPSPGEFLFEPHSAVFAAGLDGTLAVRQSLERLSNDSPYLIGSQPIQSRLFQGFEIQHVDSLDRKRMSSAFRDLDVGNIEWKQRGLEPSTFNSVSKMRGPGSNGSTVVLFRIDRSLNFAICRRI